MAVVAPVAGAHVELDVAGDRLFSQTKRGVAIVGAAAGGRGTRVYDPGGAAQRRGGGPRAGPAAGGRVTRIYDRERPAIGGAEGLAPTASLPEPAHQGLRRAPSLRPCLARFHTARITRLRVSRTTQRWLPVEEGW